MSKRLKSTHKEYNDSNQLYGLNQFNPNNNQKHVNNLLREYPLVFVQGCAGTGKTTGILYHYCKEYINDPSKTIIVIRTPVEAGGDKIGFLPGEAADKIQPHFISAETIIKNFIGKNKFECDYGNRIQFLVPNYALGVTWDNALILIDEAQQLSPAIMKLLLERLGQNTVCAVVGDPTQLYTEDAKKRNGLSHAMNTLFIKHEYGGRTEYEPRSRYIASFAYSPNDNVRSDISREIVKLYNS